MPLATVLVGMDRAFEQSANVTSLAYCRRRVEELAAAGPRPPSRPAPPAESIALSEVEALLAALLEQLQKVEPAAGTLLRAAAAEDPRDPGPAGRGLAAQLGLRALEAARDRRRRVARPSSAPSPPEQLDEFRTEAARAIERHRGRVDDDGLEDAKARFTLQRARETLGLPRVSFV